MLLRLMIRKLGPALDPQTPPLNISLVEIDDDIIDMKIDEHMDMNLQQRFTLEVRRIT